MDLNSYIFPLNFAGLAYFEFTVVVELEMQGFNVIRRRLSSHVNQDMTVSIVYIKILQKERVQKVAFWILLEVYF